MTNSVATVILAGGEGKRMGGTKPLRILAGERLIDRALESARHWSDAVAVAIHGRGQVGAIDAPLLIDEVGVAGPLAGLIAAMKFARDSGRPFVLVIPADMPFLPRDLLQRLREAIDERSCAMTSSGGNLHPVCALWHVSALERIGSYLRTERRSLRGLAEAVGFVAVEWPGGPSDPFFNINSTGDLARAEQRMAG